MILSTETRVDLMWWLENMEIIYSFPMETPFSLYPVEFTTLHSDASATGGYLGKFRPLQKKLPNHLLIGKS